MRNTMALVVLGLALAACTPPDEEQNIPRVAEGPLKARDKALGVQQTLDQAAEQRQQQIDEQSQQ
jgi:hypothetical protein